MPPRTAAFVPEQPSLENRHTELHKDHAIHRLHFSSLSLITLMLQDQYQYNENLWSGVGGYNPSSQASHFLPSSSTPCPTSHHTLSNAEVIINKNS